MPDAVARRGTPPPADAVDPLDLVIVLTRHRRWLVICPFVAAAIAAIVSLVIPPTYTAVTRILPPQPGQSGAAAMLNQFGALAGAAGGALGLKSSTDLYLGMLKSNSVADELITHFDLKKAYRRELQMDVRKDLAANSRFDADKSGLIVIEADARDPRLAADLANAYVDQLYRLTSTLAVTDAAQRRVFFERQLQQAKEKLADAEAALRKAMDQGGLVSVDAQSRAALETVARLRAEISAKEIQAGAMRPYATADNPDLRRVEQELRSMRQQLARLETGRGPDGEAPVPGGKGKGPDAGIGNIRLLREVKYQEFMYEFLAKQYELARVDESKDAPLVQVIDRAEPPERRSKPKRTFMVLGAAAVGFLAAVVGAFASDAFASVRVDPARQGKFAELRASWRRRS